MSNWIVQLGGRKWLAFLLLLAAVVLLVLTGAIKTETIIRDLLLGLLAVYGASNVGAKVATREPAKVEPKI